jgi:hypothetical protein
MLEEFKIIDVLDELEPNLTSIKPDVLASFLASNASKADNNEMNLSEALDQYLEKSHLKEAKNGMEEKDYRALEKEVEQEDTSEERNGEFMMTESNNFDFEFRNIMSSHIKDLSGRIAKPTFVEKVIEKKKERKKVGEGQQKRTVIGRCGNKFIKKEVVYSAPEEKKEQLGNEQ